MIARTIDKHCRLDVALKCAWICLAALMVHGKWAAGEEITNSLGMRLRLIQSGRFDMGGGDLSGGFYKDHTDFNSDNDDRPVHPVVLTTPFYLAATEVTVRQFGQFVEETGHQTSAEARERGAVGWDPTPPADNPRYLSTFRDGGGFSWRKPGFEQANDHPVVGVSFVDAQAFCRWLSEKEGAVYRLPTEAEWEYAARAGTATYFSFGDAYRGIIQRHANIGNVELEQAFPDRVRRQWLVDIERDPPDQHVFTAAVGSYAANPWGLYDLHGNVWEWCEDRYLDTAYAPYTRPGHQQVRKRAIDPLNLEKQSDDGDWRVIRGGSWFNAPIQCRSGVRGYFEAEDAACYVGFRVVQEVNQDIAAAARRRFEQAEAARDKISQLAGPFQERRDGRLTLLLAHGNLDEELFIALAQVDEPVDIYLHCQGRVTGDELAALARAPQLRGLLLTEIGADLADDDFSFLADHPELELLQITGGSNLSSRLLTHLQQHERLERLELDAAGITDEGLGQLPKLQRLQTLKLRGTASQGLVLDHFRASPLQEFSCSHCTDEGALLLANFENLRAVSLPGSTIGREGLAAIARLPRLDHLTLSDCQALTDEDFAMLGDLYELGSLNLRQTSAGDAAVAGLTRLNNLHDLEIGSAGLSDAGMRSICEIVSLRNFSLTEDATNITDAGLVDLWRLANLHGLMIAAPNVTGEGLAALHELPQLERMQLGGSGITDVALQHAVRSNSLKRLFVGSWQNGGPPALTDSGLQWLAESRNITQFDLIRSRTSVTEEGIAELRQRHPEITINIR